MSKAFELISESLNEIIEDLEKTDGKNLKREILTLKEEKNLMSKIGVMKDECTSRYN